MFNYKIGLLFYLKKYLHRFFLVYYKISNDEIKSTRNAQYTKNIIFISYHKTQIIPKYRNKQNSKNNFIPR